MSPEDRKRRRFRWRYWNNVLHRDLGYLVVALTIIYAVSGIAVNHVHDWNPNYSIERDEREIEPIGVPVQDVLELRRQLGQDSGHSIPAVAKLMNASPATTMWS